ncbi:MAG: hypothetical protein HOE90_12375 [Bacteriovoracaceae bacterium]|nr:hypothetical protein [Bacteriovoracaceae bacterium]
MEKTEEFEHTLLSNALDYLEHGIEEINGINPSSLKYAVLHIFSGTILLFKQKILQESWSLLFKDPSQATKVKYASGDFEGINYNSTISIIKNICGVKLSRSRLVKLNELRNLRNKMEHFQFEVTVDLVKVLSSNALNLAIKFIENEDLKSEFDEREEELFQEILLTARNFDHFCEERLGILKEYALKNDKLPCTCPSCFSPAVISEDGEYKCHLCQEGGFDLEEIIDCHLEQVLGISEYEIVKYGGEYPNFDCPECEARLALIPEDMSYKKYVCLSCNLEVESNQIDNCSYCNNRFVVSDDGGQLCPSCP